MSDTDSKRVCLGIITGVHGVHGEVVIKSYTQDPLDIKSYGSLRDSSNEQEFVISKVRSAKKGVVARIKGVEDRNHAENLKGTQLFIKHERLPEPHDKEEFYFTDLIGLRVVLADGLEFGTVTALHNFGAGDLIEIRPVQGKASEIFPFTKECVPNVDLAGGQITINPPETIEGEKQDDENDG